MQDLFYRTEDIKADEILNYFVETQADRKILETLKSRSPSVIVGSRGVGKSFLLRVAEQELFNNFEDGRILPVYLSFTKSFLLQTNDPLQFHHWMLSRICVRLSKALRNSGLIVSSQRNTSASLQSIGDINTVDALQKISDLYEDSWKNDNLQAINTTILPSVDDLKDAVEEICQTFDIDRIALFFDEAAHIFRPEQQRQFFTLFRDLRSPYITCNAAVYPGVTSYGDSFQPAHDAIFMDVDRDILSAEYVESMREIVEKQADSTLLTSISKNNDNFSALAYAANGNPRILLKTISRCPQLNNKDLNETIRGYYRSDIWSEHSGLVNTFSGHKALIDWGRKFIEGIVLPELQRKNAQYLEEDKKTTCYFWIHRDAPVVIKEALRLLTYTGIITGHADGMRATRSEVGTRYATNLGCLFAMEAVPNKAALMIARNLTIKRMSEYGANHPAYVGLSDQSLILENINWPEALQKQLSKSVNILDITDWQKSKLKEWNLTTIGDVLKSTYDSLQIIPYVGEKRSRRMYSAAQTAIYEYLSG